MSTLDTTSGSLTRASWRLAWPAVLQAILVNCYAFNDFFFVGRMGDPAATAALSACFALVIIFTVLVGIFPTGSMALMAQAFGAQDRPRVAALFRQGLGASLLWSIALSALSLAALPWIVQSTYVTPDVAVQETRYMWVILAGMFWFGLMRSTTAAFYACGNTRMPLTLEIFSLGVNTALNAILVPLYGIEGAAWATLASRGVPGIAGLVLLLRGHLGFSVGSRKLSDWAWHAKDLKRIAFIGLFESLSGVVYGVVYLMLNRMAGILGPAAQGGLGAGLRGIEWIAFAFGDGFLKASIAIVGQNLGAGNIKRAWEGAALNALMSAVSCQAMGVLFMLFPVELSQIVTQDPDTLFYASWYIRIMGWAMWAVGAEMSLYGAMIGAGRTHMTLLVSGVLNISRVPLAAVLLFGIDEFWGGTLWAAFGFGQAPAITGDFGALPWTIVATAMCKALLYSVYLWLTRRKARRG